MTNILNLSTISQYQLNLYLQSAIQSNNIDTINKLLPYINLPKCDDLYKITDPSIIKTIMHKWKMHTFSSIVSFDPQSNAKIGESIAIFEDAHASAQFTSLLKSTDPLIVKEFLDCLVDPQTAIPIKSLINIDMTQFGTADLLPHDPSRDIKHDEILLMFLQYYPQLKKKYYPMPGYNYQGDRARQRAYLSTRIIERPTENVGILKLMVDIFGNKDELFFQHLFRQCCDTNKIEAVECMLKLNEDFYAEIEHGYIVNYNIQNRCKNVVRKHNCAKIMKKMICEHAANIAKLQAEHKLHIEHIISAHNQKIAASSMPSTRSIISIVFGLVMPLYILYAG